MATVSVDPQPLQLAAVVDSMRALAIAGALAVGRKGPGDSDRSLRENLERQERQARLLDAIEWEEDRIRGELNEGKIQGGGNPSKFSPLPPPDNNDVLCSFFRPVFNTVRQTCNIQVAIVPKIHRSYGLRFEVGMENETDAHRHSHVQLTRKFNDPKPICTTTLPASWPQSYPAVFTGCSTYCDVWLSVLTAIYGFSESDAGGLRKIVNGQPAITDNTNNPAIWSGLMDRASFILRR
jgi:hypothetical protein